MPPKRKAVSSTAASAAAESNDKKKKNKASSSSSSSSSSSTPSYYLMKSEPHEFSVDDLAARPDQTNCWEGVRNHQAKNLMRGMKKGDKAFFYHSSCKVPGIVGWMEVSKEAYPDHYQWEKSSKYFDATSQKDIPRWWMVDVTLKEKFGQ